MIAVTAPNFILGKAKPFLPIPSPALAGFFIGLRLGQYHRTMAKHDNDGAASLNEVFSAAADTISTGLSAIWNYHIPFDSIVLIIGVVVLIPAGFYLAFFLYGTGIVLVRMATWTGVILWDLLTITWLLSRRQLRRL